MTAFEMAAGLIVLAAVFSYLNYTLLKLPTAIGLMALTLGASLLLVLVGLAVPAVETAGRGLVARIDLHAGVPPRHARVHAVRRVRCTST